MKGRMSMNQHIVFSNESTLHLNVAGLSVTGPLLKRNADAFALFDLSDARLAERWGQLYLLADGIGSHSGGEIASRIAVETIPVAYYYGSDGTSILGRLQQAFFAAQTRIHEFVTQNPEYAGMATTCTAAVIKGMGVWIAYLGDSRVYLVRPSSRRHPTIMRLTTDHTMVAAQVRAGNLTPEQMRHSPVERDILLRALGESTENNPFPDFTMHDVRPGDIFILCSDGLWSAVSEDQIASVVSTMPQEQAGEELVRMAIDAGGDENITMIILSFSEGKKA
jgi:serine/threonine protein phosphatase PrpC